VTSPSDPLPADLAAAHAMILAQRELLTLAKSEVTVGRLSLSQTSSGWRLTENRAMLSYHEGPLQAHWLDGCRSVSVAGNA
jgi:hypothetical protein